LAPGQSRGNNSASTVFFHRPFCFKRSLLLICSDNKTIFSPMKKSAQKMSSDCPAPTDLSFHALPWWRGKVVIASASRTEDPVFESRLEG
jgi:hypothetical protein